MSGKANGGLAQVRNDVAMAPAVANEGIRQRNWRLNDVEFSLRFALIKHDAAIAKAAVRQIAKRTADLLTVLIGLPLLAIIARAWLEGLPIELRDLLAYGASALIATVGTKALLERVWFHQSEGALARFAQRSSDWLSYIVPLLAAGIIAGLSAMAAVGIVNLGSAALGICAGVAGGLAIPFVRERVRRWWRDLTPTKKFDVLRHKNALTISAAVSCAIGTICALLPEDNILAAILAGIYNVVVILLTGRVDAASVRYMTLVGQSSFSLLRHWLPIQLALLVPVGAVLVLAQNWIAAGVVAAATLGLLVLTTLRIFAYRALSRLIADWVVAGLIAATGYVALTFPLLGPVIMTAAIVWLIRQGSGSRWMLA